MSPERKVKRARLRRALRNSWPVCGYAPNSRLEQAGRLVTPFHREQHEPAEEQAQVVQNRCDRNAPRPVNACAKSDDDAHEPSNSGKLKEGGAGTDRPVRRLATQRAREVVAFLGAAFDVGDRWGV